MQSVLARTDTKRRKSRYLFSKKAAGGCRAVERSFVLWANKEMMMAATDDNICANAPTATDEERDLTLTRLIDAPREKLFRCWTEPELLRQWFAPKPWETPRVEADVRPGGSSMVVMRGPDGTEFASHGIYLEVVENERLVFTDAFIDAWTPSKKPFMTAIVTFEDEDGKTRYTARARHWTIEDREQHEKMGFHEGWGQCADQLEALARTL
jgi:uncharacterized protein YndB with AHSA1/START domain